MKVSQAVESFLGTLLMGQVRTCKLLAAIAMLRSACYDAG
jgi:hypothetical protein